MRNLISRDFLVAMAFAATLILVMILDQVTNNRINQIQIEVTTHTGEILILQGEVREVLHEVRQHTRHIQDLNQAAIERIEARLAEPRPLVFTTEWQEEQK